MSAPPLAVVFGLAGPALAAAERDFFRSADPLGFILFARNCESPAQVRALVADLRETVGRADAPVLIDQEGGRVARLGPPHWPARPAAARYGALMDRGEDIAAEAAWLGARLIARDLFDLGITVDCAPVLDLPVPGAHDVIGERAFAADAATVSRLGRAFCDGLLAGGVLPVVKHVPGHGRARADSHRALPTVETPLDALAATDFAPFRALADMPWAMTAHVLFPAIDPAAPVTVSATAIASVVRGTIGFDGVLVSDDLAMAALSGAPGVRARAALAAGCDVALHCSGDLPAMAEIADAARRIDAAGAARLARAAQAAHAPEPFDAAAAEARLGALLAGADA